MPFRTRKAFLAFLQTFATCCSPAPCLSTPSSLEMCICLGQSNRPWMQGGKVEITRAWRHEPRRQRHTSEPNIEKATRYTQKYTHTHRNVQGCARTSSPRLVGMQKEEKSQHSRLAGDLNLNQAPGSHPCCESWMIACLASNDMHVSGQGALMRSSIAQRRELIRVDVR